MNILKLTFRCLFFIGLSLLSINIFGLFQDIRPKNITNEQLRFIDDQPLNYEETLNSLARKSGENDTVYATRITKVISAGLAHIL